MANEPSRISDLIVERLYVSSVAQLPQASIGNTQISPTAAIAASKVTQQRVIPFRDGNSDDAAATKTFPLAAAVGAGAYVRFSAGLIDACAGAATVTVDLLKNGSTVLDAPITLDNSQADRELVDAVFDLPIVEPAADDVFEVAIVATAGGGTLGKGLFGHLIINEAAAT